MDSGLCSVIQYLERVKRGKNIRREAPPPFNSPCSGLMI